MSAKSTNINRFDSGITWIADDLMQRASHAVATGDGRVWLIDPVIDEEALKAVRGLGEPTAVLQLLGRHNRDCKAVAERLGVPLLRYPDFTPERVEPFQVVPLVNRRRWKEAALWWPEQRLLIVPEAVGGASVFTFGKGRLGVHPTLRMFPPKKLADFEPEHLLLGHGADIHVDATAELRTALERSRRDIPRMMIRLPLISLSPSSRH